MLPGTDGTGDSEMTRVRAYRAPIMSIAIAVGLVAALLLVVFAPQGDPQAAEKRTVRNFDKNVQLTATSGITLSFTPKPGTCSKPKCGKFSGTVTSRDSRCLAGRTVTITGPGGFSTTTTTTATGTYSTEDLTKLASGTYTATVSASSGYGFTCDAATSNTVVV